MLRVMKWRGGLGYRGAGVVWLSGWLLLACVVLPLHADVLTGNPPVARFTPGIDVYPQNFATAQDARGIIYVGNSEGVLSFDGAHWQLVRMPNHKWARSLAYDGHDRIYVGGYGVFGYLDHDAAGQPVFHDLTPEFKALLKGRSFADVWSIAIAPEGVLFQSLHHLFLYRPSDGSVRMWLYPGRFGAIVNYRGRLFAQFRRQGFKVLQQGSWIMLPGGAALTNHVYSAILLADGGLLMLATDGAWQEYHNGKLKAFPVPRGFPPSSYFTAGLTLNDGTLVLTSVDGYLYFMSAQGRVLQKVRVDDGYLSGIVAARHGGILTSADQAVIRVGWPAAWTVLDTNQGLGGGLIRAVQWDDRWVMLTGAGVYVSEHTPEGEIHFRRTSWSQHESWDLLPLGRDTALLADSYAVLEVHADRVRPVTHAHLYPRRLLRSHYDPNLVYVGTEEGIATLVRERGHWRLRLDRENMGGLGVNSMVEVAPHVLWIGSERGGAHLLTFSADYARILTDRHMDEADGLEYGKDDRGANVFKVPGMGLTVSTQVGEFLWHDGKFHTESFGNLSRLRNPDERLTFAVAGKVLWAFDYNRVFRRLPDSIDWQEEPISGLRKGAALQTLTPQSGGGVVLVSNHAVMCYSPMNTETHPVSRQVMLRAVLLTRADGRKQFLPLNDKEPLRLPQADFSLTFEFALPDYARQDVVRYAARLAGFEPAFSDWDSAHQYTYSHLRAIEYTFYVQGRDGGGHVSVAEPFRFIIVPRWYASDWARALWIGLVVLLGILGAVGFVRIRIRRLAADRLQLENMVADRTAELEAANRKLETMAHLDGLTGIANRRRLDDYLEQVWQQSTERQRALSLLVIDVDHFKAYNDRYGHLAGDQLLKKLVNLLSRCLRRTEDLLARYGGEEFLVVLPGADIRAAHELAEHMRLQVETATLGVTISIGLASCLPPATFKSVTDLVNQADNAMYQAKAAGRNRSVIAN